MPRQGAEHVRRKLNYERWEEHVSQNYLTVRPSGPKRDQTLLYLLAVG